MADIRTPKADDVRMALSGLSYLVTGEVSNGNTGAASVQSLSLYLRQQAQKVNSNIRPQGQPGQDGNLTAADQPKGARDNLKDITTRVQAGIQVPPQDLIALQSAMYFGGYDVSFGSNFSNADMVKLTDFQQNYLDNPSASLNGLQTFNTGLANASDAMGNEINSLTQAAAEEHARQAAADAAAQGFREDRFDAGLVYSGYLDTKDLGNLEARQQAMYDLILDNQYQVIDGTHDLSSRMREYFGADGTAPISETGIAKMVELTSKGTGAPPLLQEHLESGDPQLIAVAQNYMALEGHAIAPEEMGILTESTFNVGNEMLRADIARPPSIDYLDGSGLNYGQISRLANQGALPIPAEADYAKYLDAAEIEAVNDLPNDYITREEFIATAMLDDADGTPATYNQFIADYNAANDNLTIGAEPVNVAAIAEESLAVPNTIIGAELSNTALPDNLSQVIAAHARDNGGVIQPHELPILVAKAEGRVAPDAIQSLDKVETIGHAVGVDPRATITLDPSSPEYSANMQAALGQAYALENYNPWGESVTPETLPADVAASIEMASTTQVLVTESQNVARLEDLGLPTDMIDRLGDLPSNTTPEQFTMALVQAHPETFGSRVSMDDPATTLLSRGFYNDNAPAAIKDLAEGGTLDLSNPQDLGTGLMLAQALKDGKQINDVYATPGAETMTMAVAQGYLGTDVSNYSQEIQTAYGNIVTPTMTGQESIQTAAPAQEDLLAPTNILPTPQPGVNISLGSLWPFPGTTMFQGDLPANDTKTPSIDMTQSFGASVSGAPLMSTPKIDLNFGETSAPNMSQANPDIFNLQ